MKAIKYKPSELGPIPEDWEVKSFEDTFRLIRNNTLAREALTDVPGTIADVHYGDVLIKYGAVLDFNRDEVPYLKPGVKPSKDTLRDGDIIFADTAEDESVGKAVEVQSLGTRAAVPGLHTVACRPVEGVFAPRFLAYYINSSSYHNQLLPLITGTKVSSVSRAGFVSTSVLVPPLDEQKKIAEALSDVDALISSLDRLIEKKRAIKQGAMQQLLTGKKRLAGFTGKWVEKKLGECGTWIGGGTPSTHVAGYWKGDIPWISSSDIVEDDVRSISKTRFISMQAVKNSATSICPKGTIHIVARVGVGKVAVAEQDECTSQDYANLVARDTDIYFLAYLLSRKMKEKKEETQGTSIKGLSLEDLKKIDLCVPTTLQEQKAIAVALLDMDDEIVALEQKRAKFESIKQGMMQNLLTGKMRLGV